MVSHDLKLQIAKYKSQTKTKSQTTNSKRLSTVDLLLTWATHYGSFPKVLIQIKDSRGPGFK